MQRLTLRLLEKTHYLQKPYRQHNQALPSIFA
jgi:hypothetical protein